ncbi:MAG: CaiB/BaiF CoA-transferase family protein [Pseudomonadota bacterium]
MTGPLAGLRVVEMAGIGPAPFCAMLLADMGADVVRIDRLGASGLAAGFPPKFDMLNRNKRSLAVDLKHPLGRATVADMIAQADVVIEGFRPGVMEKLGLGPEVFAARNPRLVYGRMTGWGQTGPLAQAAGHDLNYIAITGALAAIGPKGGPPVVPLNLVGDFGGGSLYLAMGVLAAVIAARASGRGQVVDAAIVDGVASLLTLQHAMYAMGTTSLDRGSNLIDGGAPFYTVYETRDGRWISVGAIEPKFYHELVDRIGLSDAALPAQMDRANWPALRRALADRFAQKTRDEWCALLEGTDSCFAPVLDLDEAAGHPHNEARANHVTVGGVVSPAAAPRFSAMPGDPPMPASPPGAEDDAILSDWGVAAGTVAALRAGGAIAGSL